MKDRDAQILQHIVNYCEEIRITIERFGKSEKNFLEDFVYRNAVSMPILQIGELVNHLSNEFKSKYYYISWHEIVGMRNHFAHGYQVMNFSEIWVTAISEVPDLNKICKDILQENNFSLPINENENCPTKEQSQNSERIMIKPIKRTVVKKSPNDDKTRGGR